MGMRITALEPQQTNAERMNVFADGRFLLGADATVVFHLGLQVGQELTAEQLTQLRQEEAVQQAVERAYNFLSYRPRSREEVRRYLKRKETPSEITDAVLERLETLDLINDRSFTSFWKETREQFNPRGARALKSELRMKGVEREVVDELVDEEHDEDLALKAGRKKALSLLHGPEMDFATFRTRLSSFLQRRGFSYEITARTTKTLWQTLQPDAPDPQHEM